MISKLQSWFQRHEGWRGLSLDFSLGAIASLSLLPAGILPVALLFDANVLTCVLVIIDLVLILADKFNL